RNPSGLARGGVAQVFGTAGAGGLVPTPQIYADIGPICAKERVARHHNRVPFKPSGQLRIRQTLLASRRKSRDETNRDGDADLSPAPNASKPAENTVGR